MLSTGLVTHQKQREAGIASPLLPSPFSYDLTLSSVQLSALALDLADLSRSFYSTRQLDKRRQEAAFFFSPSERGERQRVGQRGRKEKAEEAEEENLKHQKSCFWWR